MPALLHHEVRQVLDTRGSRVAMALGALAVLALMAGIVFVLNGDSASVPVAEAVGIVVLLAPLTIALVAVLAASGEWTHGTAGITVPMVASRSALFAAKLLAVVVVSLALFLSACAVVALGAVAVTLVRGGAVDWAGTGQQLVAGAVATLLASFFGFGMTMLIRGFVLSVLAVVGVTLGWNAFAAMVLHDDAGHLQSLTPLALATAGQATVVPPATAIASSLFLWYVLPLVLGWFRYSRADL